MSIAHDALRDDPAFVRRKISVDHVFGTTFRIWARRRRRVLLVGALLVGPSVLLDYGLPYLMEVGGLGALFGLGVPLRIAVVGALWAGIAPMVLDELRGTTTPLGPARFLALLLRAGLGSLLFGLLVGMGALGLMLPGIVIAILLYVLVPCAMFNRGREAGINHAAKLTKGFRWRLALVGLVVVVAYFAAQGAGQALMGLLAPALVEALGEGGARFALEVLDCGVRCLVVSPLVIISTTVVFHALSPQDRRAEIDRVFG